jgi:excisionase family DNA binding protein
VKETGTNPSMTGEPTSTEGRNTGHSNTPLIPQTTETDLYLTAQEAAKIARIHPGTLLRWAREGRVPHRRLSARKVVFPLSQLNSWLTSGYAGSAVRAA